MANKSDLQTGSQERAAQGALNEPHALGAETKANAKVKAKFKAVVTATMKRRALKPKKAKAESSR